MQRLMSTVWGKILIGIIGLLVVCCVFGAIVSRTNPSTTTGSVPAGTAAPPEATTAPEATAAPEATEADQVEPTAAPEATAVPTEPPLPTKAPEPTAAPEPTSVPTDTPVPPTDAPAPVAEAPAEPPPAASTGGGHTFNGETVDPAWWPCNEGQIKGNRNSGIFHIPTGRDYAKTYKNVACFDTAAAAVAAGYRQAKR